MDIAWPIEILSCLTPLLCLFNELSHWKQAENATAAALQKAGWTVEQGVKVIIRGLPGELSVAGVVDFLATKNGEILVGEVKDGLGAKLSPFQKALIGGEEALARLEIVSAGRAESLGLKAGTSLLSQLNIGSKIMYSLTGELGGRAAGEWARRNGGALATRVLFNTVKVVGSAPVLLMTWTD